MKCNLNIKIFTYLLLMVFISSGSYGVEIEQLRGIDEPLSDESVDYAPSKGVLYIRGNILKNKTRFSSSRTSKAIKEFIGYLYNFDDDQRITNLSNYPGKFLHSHLIGKIIGELERPQIFDANEERQMKSDIENLLFDSLQKDFNHKEIQGKEKRTLALIRNGVQAYKTKRMKSDPANLKAARNVKAQLNEQFVKEIMEDNNIKKNIVESVYNELIPERLKETLREKLFNIISDDKKYANGLGKSKKRYDELTQMIEKDPSLSETFETEMRSNNIGQNKKNLEDFIKKLTDLPKEETYPILTSMIYEQSTNDQSKKRYLDYYKGLKETNQDLYLEIPENEKEWIKRSFEGQYAIERLNFDGDRITQLYMIENVKSELAKVKTIKYARMQDIDGSPGDCGENSLRTFFDILSTNKNGKRDISILEKIEGQTNHSMKEIKEYFGKYDSYTKILDKAGSQKKRLEWFMMMSDLNKKHPDNDIMNDVVYNKNHNGLMCEIGNRNGGITNMLNVIKKLTGVKSWDELNKVIEKARDDKFTLVIPTSDDTGNIKIITNTLGDYLWRFTNVHFEISPKNENVDIRFEKNAFKDTALISLYPYSVKNYKEFKEKFKYRIVKNPFHYMGEMNSADILNLKDEIKSLDHSQLIDLYGYLSEDEEKNEFIKYLSYEQLPLFDKEITRLLEKNLSNERSAKYFLNKNLLGEKGQPVDDKMLDVLLSVSPAMINDVVNNEKGQALFKSNISLIDKFVLYDEASGEVFYEKIFKEPTDEVAKKLDNAFIESEVEKKNPLEPKQFKDVLNWLKIKNDFMEDIPCNSGTVPLKISQLREYAQNIYCSKDLEINKIVKEITSNGSISSFGGEIKIEGDSYIVEKLSGGANSLVYEIKLPTGKSKVLKVVSFTKDGVENDSRNNNGYDSLGTGYYVDGRNNDPAYENAGMYVNDHTEKNKAEKLDQLKDFFIARELSKENHPLIEGTCSIGDYGAVIMKKGTSHETGAFKVNSEMKGTFKVFKDQVCSLNKLHQRGIIHGDPHLGNLIKFKGHSEFLDFGNSLGRNLGSTFNTGYRKDINFGGELGGLAKDQYVVGKDYHAVGLNMIKLLLWDKLPKDDKGIDILKPKCLGRFSDIESDPSQWSHSIGFGFGSVEGETCGGQPYLTPTSLAPTLKDNDTTLDDEKADKLSILIYRIISSNAKYWPKEEELMEFVGSCEYDQINR